VLTSNVAPWIDGALGRTAGRLDVTLTRLTLSALRRKRTRLRDISRRRPMYEQMAEEYAAIDPAVFYAAPPPIRTLREHVVRRLPGGTVFDLTWASDYEPRLASARERFRRWPVNDLAHARLFRHDGRGAPALIWIHGYRGGPFAIEERLCRAVSLFESGFDVALFTLPFHGARAPLRMAPLFPSQGSVPRTNEGMGQMAWDARGLIGWLRARGAGAVGIVGMSLGGYCASLLGTIEPLDFLVPFVPMADITDAVVAHEAFRGVFVDDEVREASRRSLTIHRPLARTPVVRPERVLVVGAAADQITGPSHAERLADHFGAEVAWFPGGHLLQYGRALGFQAMRRFLDRCL
jgi:pimeloyl-ACP methyl ester carboxylesterase